jgi:hypothetical protein
VVSSSGFRFETREATVVVHAPRELVPLAELEYLREAAGRELAGGRIAMVRRLSGDGRKLHLVTVALPGGGERSLTFDAGPALLGHLRHAYDALQLGIYGLVALLAVATLGYAVMTLAR